MTEETQYDVFLSHNSQDKPAVERLAQSLRNRGLEPFLDRWHLRPGLPWPQALEEVLRTCGAVAVFLGPHGLGGWQAREMYLALERQKQEPLFPVIPVLLADADPALSFLTLNTWVDAICQRIVYQLSASASLTYRAHRSANALFTFVA